MLQGLGMQATEAGVREACKRCSTCEAALDMYLNDMTRFESIVSKGGVGARAGGGGACLGGGDGAADGARDGRSKEIPVKKYAPPTAAVTGTQPLTPWERDVQAAFKSIGIDLSLDQLFDISQHAGSIESE